MINIFTGACITVVIHEHLFAVYPCFPYQSLTIPRPGLRYHRPRPRLVVEDVAVAELPVMESSEVSEGRKEIFYLTTHSTHFI